MIPITIPGTWSEGQLLETSEGVLLASSLGESPPSGMLPGAPFLYERFADTRSSDGLIVQDGTANIAHLVPIPEGCARVGTNAKGYGVPQL